VSPDDYCAGKASPSGSSLYYALHGLSPPRQRAIAAVHAFCREVNEVVREVADPGVARLKLGWWRTEIAAAFDGRGQHPVTRALGPAIAGFELPLERFEAMIDGAARELERGDYPDFAAIVTHCERVAGSAWMLTARICGGGAEPTLAFAVDVGLALRLTSIIRDLGRDLRRGRIYLAQDALAQFGLHESDLVRLRLGDSFTTFVRNEAERAHSVYARARAALPAADRRTQRPARIMAAIGEALLVEIERDGFRVLERRTALTPLAKAWIAWKTSWWR
jgi:15-cis-phytoene synthase